MGRMRIPALRVAPVRAHREAIAAVGGCIDSSETPRADIVWSFLVLGAPIRIGRPWVAPQAPRERPWRAPAKAPALRHW